MEFGLKFRELRGYYKNTQTELAKICDVSRHVISQIELDHNNPSLLLINRLSIFYQITRDYFFEEDMDIANAVKSVGGQDNVRIDKRNDSEKESKIVIKSDIIASSELNHLNELIKEKDKLIDSLSRELKKSDEIISLLKISRE